MNLFTPAPSPHLRTHGVLSAPLHRAIRWTAGIGIAVGLGWAGRLQADDSQHCDAFLQIPGIQGDCQDLAHRGEITAHSFTYTACAQSGAANASGPVFQLTKDIDRTSPELSMAVATGRHFPSATVTVRLSGAAADSYLVQYRLSDMKISSITQTINADHVSQEALNLSFGRIAMQYGGTEQANASAPRPAAGSTAGGVASAGTPMTLETGVAPGSRFVVTPDPSLKGRLGRLVINFPKDAKVGDVRTMIFPGNDRKEASAQAYGNTSFDLLPGSYTLTIANMPVEGVAVQPASVTRIAVGVLRTHLKPATRYFIYASSVPDGSDQQTNGYGEKDIGLPVGTYRVVVNGQADTVTITDGQITDF